MTRPNAKEFIDSSNPEDNSKLLPDNTELWHSGPGEEAMFTITPDSPVLVMSTEIPKVVGATDVVITLLYKNDLVEQIKVDASESVSILKALHRLFCAVIICEVICEYV